MIVTAALAWYDEAPEDLDRYVRALPIACDRLVAVDGGYARYPGAKPRSATAEKAALTAAARDIGLDISIHVPVKVWAGQVEKRSHLLALAAEGSDWVFTLDADHILHGIREPFRHELESVSEDAVETAFYTTPNYDKPLQETASTAWHERLNGETIWIRLLMRALPGMQAERFHCYVSALKDGHRVWLKGEDPAHPTTESHELAAPLFIEHRCMYRRERNIIANRVFCEDRVAIVEATGQEDVVAA